MPHYRPLTVPGAEVTPHLRFLRSGLEFESRSRFRVLSGVEPGTVPSDEIGCGWRVDVLLLPVS